MWWQLSFIKLSFLHFVLQWDHVLFGHLLDLFLLLFNFLLHHNHHLFLLVKFLLHRHILWHHLFLLRKWLEWNSERLIYRVLSTIYLFSRSFWIKNFHQLLVHILGELGRLSLDGHLFRISC